MPPSIKAHSGLTVDLNFINIFFFLITQKLDLQQSVATSQRGLSQQNQKSPVLVGDGLRLHGLAHLFLALLTPFLWQCHAHVKRDPAHVLEPGFPF